MLGYDYEIIYKKGHENVVVDALSRQFEDESTLLSISLPIPDWIEEAHKECFPHPSLSKLINNLREDPNSSIGYSWKDEIIFYKDRVVISLTSILKMRILAEILISHCKPCRLSEDLCSHSLFFILDGREKWHSYFCSWMWCVSTPQGRNSQVTRNLAAIATPCLCLDGCFHGFHYWYPKVGQQNHHHGGCGQTF